jgi:hypothetical protein
MRLSVRGFTLPWQLVELQEPGPVYLLVSAGGMAARAGFAPTATNAPKANPAQWRVKRLDLIAIFILVFG